MAEIDWTDPCARAIALRSQYYAAVGGGSESQIRTRGPDSEQEVRYHKGDLGTLRLELQRAEDECRAKNGEPPLVRRFAITAGSRRVWPPRRF